MLYEKVYAHARNLDAYYPMWRMFEDFSDQEAKMGWEFFEDNQYEFYSFIRNLPNQTKREGLFSDAAEAYAANIFFYNEVQYSIYDQISKFKDAVKRERFKIFEDEV